MPQIIIGTKNQIVIPKEVRDQLRDLKPGATVNVYVRGKNEVIIKADKKSWVKKTRGIAKKTWANMDPIAVLEKMRNEW